MKLIFAGQSVFGSVPPYQDYLFNCTRNPRCQKEYFVPIRQLSDIQFYIDLPGKPTLITATLFNLCEIECEEDPGDFNDDFNDDFDIGGEGCAPAQCTIVFQKYVVGQTPAGGWYGVFSDPVAECIIPKCFFLKIAISINESEFIYYSQQICLEECDPLCLLEGCYPNEPVGSDAFDCNGLYYGFPVGNDYLGTKNYRYFHKAYVRKCDIIDQSVKLSFTYFNSKRNYKTQQTNERMLEFELVPSFYKDELIAIFARGNIRRNGIEYRLSDEQNWKILDNDSKLWQLDAMLVQECKLLFGCGPADCLLPPEECVNNVEFGEYTFDELGNILFHFIGDFTGVMNILYELYEVDPIDGSTTLVSSGTSPVPPGYLTIDTNGGEIDPDSKCYLLKWKVDCGYAISGEWKEQRFGVCDQETALEGLVSMYSYGGGTEGNPQQCSAQGATKLRFRFNAPTPAAITLQLAYVYQTGAMPSYQGEGGNILPVGHPDKALAYSNLGQGAPFTVVIPAGTTDWLSPMIQYNSPYFPVTVTMISFPACNGSFGPSYDARIYFKVTSPGGTILNLAIANDTPAPNNPVNNAFTWTQVP